MAKKSTIFFFLLDSYQLNSAYEALALCIDSVFKIWKRKIHFQLSRSARGITETYRIHPDRCVI